MCMRENVVSLHGVSKILQYQNIDLRRSHDLLENIYISINSKSREHYNNVVKDAILRKNHHQYFCITYELWAYQKYYVHIGFKAPPINCIRGHKNPKLWLWSQRLQK